eukprot:Rmarinus@m.30099
MTDNVKVAVRVRPFNQREIEAGCRNVIRMEGNRTFIVNPHSIDQAEERQFTYDYSFWSFDEKSGDYASQQTVYDTVGLSVIENAWKGYNCSVFAYGQTGAGKSHSMLGYDPGEGAGLVPRVSRTLFDRIVAAEEEAEEPPAPGLGPQGRHKVEVSFMEIYNEHVRDLLNPSSKDLRVREHPARGPYVEGLAKLIANDHLSISRLIEEGGRTRTMAATNMNETSSRSHAVFTIIYTQTAVREDYNVMEKVSKINLVDLAGSEKMKTHELNAPHERIKESIAINKSLSCLGNVISALAERKTNQFIPYRDSVLTWLLKESLGGNARTIMLAAISPADVNYEETLNTLRYAERTKRVVNNAVINENPNQKLIRQLQEEISRLKEQLSKQGDGGLDARAGESTSQDEVNDLERKLTESQSLVRELGMSLEEQIKKTQDIERKRHAALQEFGLGRTEDVGTSPRLVNLCEDPLLNECLIFYLPPGVTRIGRSSAAVKQDVVLNGIGIRQQHALIENTGQIVSIKPIDEGARLFVNGHLIQGRTKLQPGCRVVVGRNHVFRFEDPQIVDDDMPADWYYAVEEMKQVQQHRLTNVMDQEEEELAKRYLDSLQEIQAKESALLERDQVNRQLQQQVELMTAELAKNKFEQAKALSEHRRQMEEEMRAKLSEAAAAPQVPSPKELNGPVKPDIASENAATVIGRAWRRVKQARNVASLLVAVMKDVEEANHYTKVMGKMLFFEPYSLVTWPDIPDVAPSYSLANFRKVEMACQVTNTFTRLSDVWTRKRFSSFLSTLRESHSLASVYKSEPPPILAQHPKDSILGKCYVFLRPLVHGLPVDTKLAVIGLDGTRICDLAVSIVLTKDIQSETPQDLLNKRLDVILQIVSASRFSRAALTPGTPLSVSSGHGLYCRYRFVDADAPTVTKAVAGQNMTTEAGGLFRFDCKTDHTVFVTSQEQLSHLYKGYLAIELVRSGQNQAFDVLTTADYNGSRVEKNVHHFDFRIGVDMYEGQNINEVLPVPLKTVNSGGHETHIFKLRQGMARRVYVTLLQEKGTFLPEKVVGVNIGRIRLDTSSESSTVPPLLSKQVRLPGLHVDSQEDARHVVSRVEWDRDALACVDSASKDVYVAEIEIDVKLKGLQAAFYRFCVDIRFKIYPAPNQKTGPRGNLAQLFQSLKGDDAKPHSHVGREFDERFQKMAQPQSIIINLPKGPPRAQRSISAMVSSYETQTNSCLRLYRKSEYRQLQQLTSRLRALGFNVTESGKVLNTRTGSTSSLVDSTQGINKLKRFSVGSGQYSTSLRGSVSTPHLRPPRSASLGYKISEASNTNLKSPTLTSKSPTLVPTRSGGLGQSASIGSSAASPGGSLRERSASAGSGADGSPADGDAEERLRTSKEALLRMRELLARSNALRVQSATELSTPSGTENTRTSAEGSSPHLLSGAANSGSVRTLSSQSLNSTVSPRSSPGLGTSVSPREVTDALPSPSPGYGSDARSRLLSFQKKLQQNQEDRSREERSSSVGGSSTLTSDERREKLRAFQSNLHKRLK